MDHRKLTLHRMLGSCVVVLLTCLGTPATASEFDTFSEHAKLVDQQILAVGDIAIMERPSAQPESDYRFGLYRLKLYQLGRFCFASSDNLKGKAGLLLVDRSSTLSVATISSAISGIMVYINAVTNMDCESIRQQDAQQTLDKIDNQRKQIELLLESLKKQQKQLKSNQ